MRNGGQETKDSVPLAPYVRVSPWVEQRSRVRIHGSEGREFDTRPACWHTLFPGAASRSRPGFREPPTADVQTSPVPYPTGFQHPRAAYEIRSSGLRDAESVHDSPNGEAWVLEQHVDDLVSAAP